MTLLEGIYKGYILGKFIKWKTIDFDKLTDTCVEKIREGLGGGGTNTTNNYFFGDFTADNTFNTFASARDAVYPAGKRGFVLVLNDENNNETETIYYKSATAFKRVDAILFS